MDRCEGRGEKEDEVLDRRRRRRRTDITSSFPSSFSRHKGHFVFCVLGSGGRNISQKKETVLPLLLSSAFCRFSAIKVRRLSLLFQQFAYKCVLVSSTKVFFKTRALSLLPLQFI